MTWKTQLHPASVSPRLPSFPHWAVCQAAEAPANVAVLPAEGQTVPPDPGVAVGSVARGLAVGAVWS